MFKQMEPITIKINGKSVQIGIPIKVIKSLEIQHMGLGIQIPKNQTKFVVDWLWDIVQRCENEYIEYQGVLILKTDVKEYKGK